MHYAQSKGVFYVYYELVLLLPRYTSLLRRFGIRKYFVYVGVTVYTRNGAPVILDKKEILNLFKRKKLKLFKDEYTM